MKHGVKKTKFTQGQDAHQALTRKLLRNFMKHGHIETTLKRAKVLKAMIDRLMVKALRGAESDKNVIMKHVADVKLLRTLLNDIAPRMKGRTGGYVKMTRLGVRQGDFAEVARLDWTVPVASEKVESEPTEKKAATKARASKKTASKSTSPAAKKLAGTKKSTVKKA